MSESYAVPGVYIEERGSRGMSIQTGETAVPVLIGHFNAIDPTSSIECVRVESWFDFLQRFDSSDTVEINEEVFDATWGDSGFKHTAHVGSYSVRLYFENGGGPCYVLHLPKRDDSTLTQMVEAIKRWPDITLLVWCEHVDEDPQVYAKLATLLGTSADSNGNSGRFLLTDAQAIDEKCSAFVVPAVASKNDCAAAYFPALLSQYRWEPSDRQVTVKNFSDAYRSGGVPIELGESVTLEDLRQRQLKALTSGDPHAPVAAHKYQALYSGIRQVVTEALQSQVILRASVAMAGVMAHVDRERGVWKAPANVGLASVIDLKANVAGATHPQEKWLSVRVDDTMNGQLVENRINPIRTFRGRGTIVYGARTMVEPGRTDWRYISVRRLCDTVERDARAALRTVVFEPNNASTWESVRGGLDHYLHALWRQGALQGETPAQAYDVQIGLGVTMVDDDVKAGRLIVRVGLAVVKPAEFIVLQLTQDMASA
ncbi:phage tail sheath family protein [Burkholderia stagnalis]|uniref:phage tail sheath family protein n=1 Tax=Burkholderia stagnalis TaxID=1503054 RepID=UPI0007573646|nr:phage tail sheath C-terminal domain-containing protein [Burkholderia stagnalis]KWI28411.1 hypothetical protein WT71_16240 [Burkholderia stagnalis]KWI70998.1 hypothetical protein WT73_14025 [Burkholderia stagnalis]MDY7806681.1 phage tail sheath C-terminal domain-containing protein [Burkholderia stagnalis]